MQRRLLEKFSIRYSLGPRGRRLSGRRALRTGGIKAMKVFLAISFALVPGWFGVWCVFAGQASPTLTKAKQEAESRGYVFYTNRDEIVAKAKKEGKLRILVNMEVPTLKAA